MDNALPERLPPQAKDHTGGRFGRLVALRYVGRAGGESRSTWLCACDCGSTKLISAHNLSDGRTKSCGCIKAETIGAVNRTHGMAHSRTSQTWSAMKSRCTNPRQQSYQKYGALGVRVCVRWQSFENFLADMGERPPGKTLDRRNPFGDYEPNNCRWSDATEQANNRRADIAMRMLRQLPGPVFEKLLADALAATKEPDPS